MEQRKTNSISQKIFHKQPIMCPWITTQPYPSTLHNKNRNRGISETNLNCPINSHWSNIQMEAKTHDKTCPSMQQSSSQFFYFLRLMQLFPDTHPATLHTVLTLCKNDFFCAVDKLLYAKRCKVMYNRRQSLYQKFCHNRSHPYSTNVSAKASTCQTKEKNTEKTAGSKLSVEKPFEPAKKQSVIVKPNETIPEVEVEETIPITVNELTTSIAASPHKHSEDAEDLSNVQVENEADINIEL